MLDFNAPNFITVALITVLAVLAVRMGSKVIGKNSPV